jgi:hypothetical protein
MLPVGEANIKRAGGQTRKMFGILSKLEGIKLKPAIICVHLITSSSPICQKTKGGSWSVGGRGPRLRDEMVQGGVFVPTNLLMVN